MGNGFEFIGTGKNWQLINGTSWSLKSSLRKSTLSIQWSENLLNGICKNYLFIYVLPISYLIEDKYPRFSPFTLGILVLLQHFVLLVPFAVSHLCFSSSPTLSALMAHSVYFFFYPCSELFQTPVAVLSLVFTRKAFYLGVVMPILSLKECPSIKEHGRKQSTQVCVHRILRSSFF